MLWATASLAALERSSRGRITTWLRTPTRPFSRRHAVTLPFPFFIASAPLPKFVIHGSTLWHNFGSARGTSKYMARVPLFDLKFLYELAAGAVGTSKSAALASYQRLVLRL